MINKIILIVMVLFLFAGMGLVQAAEYYVKTDGNDNLDGLSDATAWKTLSKVNSFNFQTGDDVFLKCGGAWTRQNINVDWTGTAENNVVIGAYYMDSGNEIIGVNSDGKPMIDGENIYPSNEHDALIKVNPDYDYVTIQDIYIKRSAGNGIQHNYADYGTVQRCKIDYTYRTNIHFYNADHGTALYNECSRGGMRRLTEELWPNGGIRLAQTNYGVAKYNYVYNQQGEGIDVGDYSTVQYNLVVDVRSTHIYLNAQHDSEISYNMVVGTSETDYEMLSGWHGSGIVVGVEDNSMQHFSTYNCKIHHNIVINTYAGIRMYCPNPDYIVDNIWIYNNILIDNSYNFMISNNGDRVDNNVYVKNNIAYSKHADSGHAVVWSDPLNNWDIDYNVWAGDTPPSGIWSGAHDQTGDPNFPKSIWRSPTFTMNDFTTLDCSIQTGSSAIDNGVNLGTGYDDALNSNTNFHTSNPDPNLGDPIYVNTLNQNDYGTGWEIGAFVFTGGTTPTCQSLGHRCCSSCESGPHPEYDADCSGQVCCDVCTTTNELIAHYTMDSADISGTTLFDKSGNSNHGTIYGAVSTQGQIGEALLFNGVGDYVDLPDMGTHSATTIGVWFKDSGAWTQNNPLVSHTDWAGGVFHFKVEGTGLSYPNEVTVHSESGDKLHSGIVNTGEWHHASYTLAGSGSDNFRLYLDGVEKDSGNAGTATINIDFKIGNEYIDGRWFNGAIDEVRIYNYALSSGEVLELYNSGQSICSPADTNTDNEVDILEIINYMASWKAGSVTIENLMIGIGEWKNGC